MNQNLTIETVLDQIISDGELHVRWLNTLSFLEHVGTRKIHKTQSNPKMTDLVLRHASEEARHAHFFKRMAEKLHPGHAPNYQFKFMICGFAAYRYFQSLDSMVEKYLQREEPGMTGDPFAFLCYLYVTTLIEERAGWLYPIYEGRLKAVGSEITLATVISEEERHLTDMYDALEQSDPKWRIRMDHFLSREKELYERFFAKLAAEVSPR